MQIWSYSGQILLHRDALESFDSQNFSTKSASHFEEANCINFFMCTTRPSRECSELSPNMCERQSEMDSGEMYKFWRCIAFGQISICAPSRCMIKTVVYHCKVCVCVVYRIVCVSLERMSTRRPIKIPAEEDRRWGWPLVSLLHGHRSCTSRRAPHDSL